MIKLYAITDGPPSVSVRTLLDHLKVPYQFIYVPYYEGATLGDDFGKLNPQRELPVIDDDGFLLSEHVAIMQYVCDQYAPDTDLYPKEPRKRAIINHRLCFNSSFFYTAIAQYAVGPMFFDYQQTEMALKRLKMAVDVFEEYLRRFGTKYVAGDNVTIADISLACSMTVLEAIDFNLNEYKLVKEWYQNFKNENPQMWHFPGDALKEMIGYAKNPPDMSKMNHPFHPMKKANK